MAAQIQYGQSHGAPEIGPNVRVRVRETHARDHLAPLLSKGSVGAVKLDLALRGLVHRTELAGRLPADISWESLHDLCRDGNYRATDRVLKRKWVGENLAKLEHLGLISRDKAGHHRSSVCVLRDDGSGRSFDDPGADGDAYVTVLGSVFDYRRICKWGTPEVAAYLAAMVAERYARSDPHLAHLQTSPALGGGIWFRPLHWFADEQQRRPTHHIRIPFSTRTLRRGLVALRSEGLIAMQRTTTDPRTDREFTEGRPRTIYRNGFDDLRPNRSPVQLWPSELRRPAQLAGEVHDGPPPVRDIRP